MQFEYEGINKIDLIAYLKNFTVLCNNKSLMYVAFNHAGYYRLKFLFENINFVELAQMPNEESIEIIYLYDLQLYLDELINTTPPVGINN